jgi:hypothetical protein
MKNRYDDMCANCHLGLDQVDFGNKGSCTCTSNQSINMYVNDAVVGSKINYIKIK